MGGDRVKKDGGLVDRSDDFTVIEFDEKEMVIRVNKFGETFVERRREKKKVKWGRSAKMKRRLDFIVKSSRVRLKRIAKRVEKRKGAQTEVKKSWARP